MPSRLPGRDTVGSFTGVAHHAARVSCVVRKGTKTTPVRHQAGQRWPSRYSRMLCTSDKAENRAPGVYTHSDVSRSFPLIQWNDVDNFCRTGRHDGALIIQIGAAYLTHPQQC